MSYRKERVTQTFKIINPLNLKTMDEEYEEYIWQDDESIFMPNIGDK